MLGDMADQDSFGARVLSAIRELVTGAASTDDEPGVAGWLDGAAHRLRLAATLTRMAGGTGKDQIVRSGEFYEVCAELPGLSSPLVERVRFYLDGEPIGEAEVRGGAEAHLTLRADEPGLYRVTWDAVGPMQLAVVAPDPTRYTIVQVVGAAPVVAIDAELILAGSPELFWSLRQLCQAGIDLACIDLAEAQRTETVRRALATACLPPCAIMSHAEGEAHFHTFGVSFRRVLVTHAARKARASGVALVGLVHQDTERWRGCADEDIRDLLPETLTATLHDETLVPSLRAAAAALEAEWASQNRLDLRLDRTTRTMAVAGNICRVELDNHRARRAVLDAIESARASVHIQLYILEDGRFADRLGVCLIAAARRGVAVRLLVDALYSGQEFLGLSNPVVAGLREEPGIEVRANDPILSTSGLETLALKARDHRKLIVVDDSWAVVSGRNAGDHYYYGFDEVSIADFTAHERIPWLDAHVAIEGPLVRSVAQSFVDSWRRCGGELADPAPTATSTGAMRARFVEHEGVHDVDGMAAYEALLDGATRHVLIANDFPIASPLVAAVRRALGRGVSVSLLTGNAVPRRGDGSFFRGPLHREIFEYVTKRRLEPLMRAGLQVYEYATPPEQRLIVCRGGVVRPYVHAKLMTTDGRVASVGSANLDATASYWEREANVIIEDEALVCQLEAQINTMLGHSLRIDLDSAYWKGERAAREVATRLWPDSLYS